MDPVIVALLDYIWETTGIDPAAIHPDERVIEDLNMSQRDVERLGDYVAERLRLRTPVSFQIHENLSLRQISQMIRLAMEEAMQGQEAA